MTRETHLTLRIVGVAAALAMAVLPVPAAISDCSVRHREVEQEELEYCDQRVDRCWRLYYERCLNDSRRGFNVDLNLQACQRMVGP